MDWIWRTILFAYGCYFLLLVSPGTTNATGCKDGLGEQDNCEFMKKYHWCEVDKSYLKEKCDKTCGWCSSSNECKDWATYIDCASLTQDQCNADVEKYLSRCKKSCNWCKNRPQGIWESWGKWSKCSKTCGNGFHLRRRQCLTSGCEGEDQEGGICKVRECPTWSAWSSWGGCSATCEGGRRSRTRICSHGRFCKGDSENFIDCNTHKCSELVFGVWGECSRSCGEGTRVKVERCSLNDITRCPKTYADCNAFPCPRDNSCSNYRYHSLSDCCQFEEPLCGREKSVGERVLGGEQSSAEQFPWMARIEISFGAFTQRTKCGATLIHPKYVVTAGHCVLNRKPEQLQIVLGSTLRDDTSSLIQRIRVLNYTIHPNFSNPTNDIAIIQLKRKASINERVAVLCLPNGEETPIDAKCYVAGWGKTNAITFLSSLVLMEARVRHLPFGVCENSYRRTSYGPIVDEKIMMCAGKISGGVDTCDGDSGGPLMCQRCSTCSWYLAGVTSFGANQCGQIGRPGVYTRVRVFEDWIKTIVEPVEKSKYSCSIS